jgi:threonine dehydrogenase-like Zn-dependent dehydrogenase
MEAHGAGPLAWVDGVKQGLRVVTGRPHALREAIQSCRKGGVVSIAGVFGASSTPSTSVPPSTRASRSRWGRPTSTATSASAGADPARRGRPVVRGDASGASLEEAPDMYRIFRDKEDDCVKVVLTP